MKRKPQHLLVRQATAYRRLAAKAFRAGNMREHNHYQQVAGRLMARYEREQAARAARS